MGLTAQVQRRLAGWGARRPHALVVAVPGWTAARLAAEESVHAAGGTLALSPADADLLITAGRPGKELLEAIDRVWSQVPGPAVRGTVTDPAAAAHGVDDLLLRLSKVEPRSGSRPAPSLRSGATSGRSHDESLNDQEEQDGEDDGEKDRQHGEQDGGMDMPGGLMMADRGPDRDGLTLDVLHVPWGPLLPFWPGGLVVDVEMQGDVVQSAQARLLSGPDRPTPYWSSPVEGAGPTRAYRRAAAHLDSLGRLLALAGWSSAAAQAMVLRNALLAPLVPPQVLDDVTRLRRRLLRSRSLAWATDGLGVLSADDVARWGLSGPAARACAIGGDATARWRTWLQEIDAALSGGDPAPGSGPRGDSPEGSAALARAATTLMAGLDVAAARIVMASLDPDPDELALTVSGSDATLPLGGLS